MKRVNVGTDENYHELNLAPKTSETGKLIVL